MPHAACVSFPGLCLHLPCWFGVEDSDGERTYTYNGVLSLDAGFYALLLDLDDQVSALEVAWDSGDGDI